MTDKTTDEERFSAEETAFESAPPLDLVIDDERLVEFIDTYVKNATSFYNGDKQIDQRRKRNKKYYFGKQLNDTQLKSYEKAFLDNTIKEGEDVLRPLVLSRMPDIILEKGATNASDDIVELLSTSIDKTIKSGELKKLLTRSFRDHPIYLTSVTKPRWDPNKGRFGGAVYENIHPDNIIADHTATSNNQKHMRIIVHYVEKPLKDWIMMFPKHEDILVDFAVKEKSIKGHLDSNGLITESAMAVSIKVAEVWFDWKDKAEDFDADNPVFDMKTGVAWKIDKTILDKKLDPNWDWEGEEKIFFNGQPVPEEMLQQIAQLGFDVPGLERKKVFRNFFTNPRKPFIFSGLEQYGEMPYDETSRIEGNILLQDNYDMRGMQITKMIDDSRGKHVFSSLSGLKKETVDAMDMNDPDEDVFLTGELGKVHAFIQKEQPSQAMFADLNRTHERMMERLNLSGAVRGQIESDVATTNQIARESSITSANEISDLMVNDITTQIAEWHMQFMKLRWTPEHFQELVGSAGDTVQETLAYDMIEDGLVVTVKASGTDKLQAERQAKEEAQIGIIDPVSYFKDTGRDDPEGRAEKVFLWNNAPELYFKKIIQGQDLSDIASEIQATNQQNLQQAGGQQPQLGGPQLPSPQDTQNIPTQPQGSVRNLIGKAGNAIGGIFGR